MDDLILYLVLQLDSIKIMSVILNILLGFLAVAGLGVWADYHCSATSIDKLIAVFLIILFVFSLFIAVLIPTTESGKIILRDYLPPVETVRQVGFTVAGGTQK